MPAVLIFSLETTRDHIKHEKGRENCGNCNKPQCLAQ